MDNFFALGPFLLAKRNGPSGKRNGPDAKNSIAKKIKSVIIVYVE